jgi:hypothetical protein
MSNVVLNILSEFKGKKAFDKAGKSVSGLDKAVGKLGKQLAGVFALSQVTRFGKASVNAFLEAEKANVRLAGVVKNLGMAFETAGIQRNLDKISASSGIAGELLADAFQPLLTTTKSVTEAQNLLNLALDVAAGTGKNVAEVSQDLALAYTGVTRGLRKYNLGLTQAELKASSFVEIQSLLAKQFTGSNAKYLQTYAGQLGILTEAAGLAQETIGKGLVDALVLAGGKDRNIQDVADSMQNLSTYTSDVIRGVGVLAGKLNNLSQKTGGFGLKDFVTLIPILGGYISILEKAGRESRPMGRANRNVTGRSNVTLFDADAAKAKKLEADRLKVVKAQEALLKKQTAELKRQALTKKQSALFDLDQIQLVAALQGKLTKEEQDRVKLQLALLTGNTTEADRLSKKIALSIDATGALALSLTTLPDANNPFKSWDAYLDAVLLKAKQVAGLGGGGGTGGSTGGAGGGAVVQTNAVAATVFNSLGSANASTRTADEAARLYGGMGPSKIVVQIDGKEIASAVQNQSLSGNDPLVNRLLGGFR